MESEKAQYKLRLSSYHGRYQTFALAALSIFFVGYLFGENLFAQWWIIDDHEIMWFLGKGDHLSFAQIIPKLMKTEVGSFGEYPRFRPAYYVLRLLETWGWGKHPERWYGFRLIILLYFVITIWHTMRYRVGFLTAGLLTFYTLTFGFWTDITARLGPGENYATLGLALFILGFEEAYHDGTSKKGWIILFAGTVIAAGSKENFLFLILPVAFLFTRSMIKKTMNWSTWVFTLLTLMWCVWIASAVISGTLYMGSDVYGNSVAANDRLSVLFQAAGRPDVRILFLLGFLFLLASLLFRDRQPLYAQQSFAAFISAVMLALLYLSQIVFYNGNWPANSRYDLPGMLCLPLAIFLIICYLNKLRQSLLVPAIYKTAINAGIVFIALAAAVSHVSNVDFIRQASAANVRRTVQFSAQLEDLTTQAKQHPSYPIVFLSNDPLDYEPLFSYPRFLLADGVSNEMYLLWIDSPSDQASHFQLSLAFQLHQISQNGLPGYYLPIERLKPFENECIQDILFGKKQYPCDIQIDGNWRKY